MALSQVRAHSAEAAEVGNELLPLANRLCPKRAPRCKHHPRLQTHSSAQKVVCHPRQQLEGWLLRLPIHSFGDDAVVDFQRDRALG